MPSRERRTSSSRPSAPSARPLSNAAMRVLRRERRAAAVREDQRTRATRRKDGARRGVSLVRIESTHGGPIQTLGELRTAVRRRSRPVKQEIRDNLVRKLQAGETLFPGIIGYDDTVIPQLVNAILSRHNFILLGLRGQAKSRILRGAGRSARRADPGRPRLRDSRRPARADLRRLPRARRRARATPADRAGCRARRASSRSWRRPT